MRRQLLLLATLGLIPLALLGGLLIWSAVENQRQELARSTVELSRALATAVESELEGTVTTLAALGRAQTLRSGRLAEFHGLANDEVEVRPEWVRVELADGAGRELLVAHGNGARRSVAPEPQSLAEAIRSRRPVVGAMTNGPAAVYRVRVPVLEGERLAYVITAVVKPDRVHAVLLKQHVPEAWAAAVVDQKGLRVARSQDHLASVGKSVGPSLLKLTGGFATSGFGVTTTRDGVPVYTGYTRLPRFGWFVSVGAPTAHTQAALARTLAWYIGGLLLTVLGYSYVTLRIARRVTVDIRALRDEALLLGDGKAVQPPHSRLAEVEEMGAALSSASQRLQESAESLRQALAKAETSARVKDQFLAMLGHELRNPLAPMFTALQLMDLQADPASARQREIMRRQLTQMQSLVDDLLDISRITTGKFRLRQDPVDLKELVDRALETVQSHVEERPQAIESRLPADPVWVCGDESRLLQALVNLLTNALRFCPKGRICVDLERDAGFARLAVRDEGLGMHPETLAQVFEPFYQAQQPIDRAAGGLGLGLAIVRGIVEGHGGEVRAHSDGPGTGSLFEFRLPLGDASCVPDSATHSRRPTVGASILIVDDNLDALDTMAELLRLSGHEVRAAAHPSDALALLAEFRPGVAVFDIGLPDMDGYELAAAARRVAPDWHAKMVALTGYGQEADKERAAAAGFAAHLTKPVTAEVLLETIEALLQSGAATPPHPRETPGLLATRDAT